MLHYILPIHVPSKSHPNSLEMHPRPAFYRQVKTGYMYPRSQIVGMKHSQYSFHLQSSARFHPLLRHAPKIRNIGPSPQPYSSSGPCIHQNGARPRRMFHEANSPKPRNHTLSGHGPVGLRPARRRCIAVREWRRDLRLLGGGGRWARVPRWGAIVMPGWDRWVRWDFGGGRQRRHCWGSAPTMRSLVY
jgi:hypothetical protein